MINKQQPYTLGEWTVKNGKESEFISAWQHFAQQTIKDLKTEKEAYLLQDGRNPQQFVSFGSWDNEKQIEEWRNSVNFSSFINTVKPLCEKVEPHTMKLVAIARGVERK